MNRLLLSSVKHRFCCFFLSFFIIVPLQAAPIIKQPIPINISPFYLLLIGLTIHLPFALLSFFYTVNTTNYSDRKHKETKTGLGFLLLLNGIIFSYLFYYQYYVYPSLILFFVPVLYLILGSFRASPPFINWSLAVLYMSTVIFLVLGGIYNHQGYGPKDGTYMTYYSEPSNQLKSSQQYNFGQRHGIFEQFYENGKLKSSLTYNLDTLEGLVKEFYENGKLKVIYKNHQNQVHGIYFSYYDNGHLESHRNFMHGEQIGLQKTYYKNGNLKSSCRYKDNIGTYFSYYENGKLRQKGNLNLDRKEGLWETYHSNGVLKSTGHHKIADEKHSVKDGLWKNYHMNGQLELIGAYNLGIRKGQWSKYFDTGELSDHRNYTF